MFFINSLERLQKIVEKCENQNNLKRDPNDLVMIERNDFTNYLVFFDYFKNNELLFEKIFAFNPSLGYCTFESNEERKKYFLRYLYSIIFEVYTSDFAHEHTNEISAKLKEKEEEEKFAGNIFEDPQNYKAVLKNEENDIDKTKFVIKKGLEKENEEKLLSPEKENKANWEIDDKLLIFS